MRARKVVVVCILLFQIILIVLFSFFTEYDRKARHAIILKEVNGTVVFTPPGDAYAVFQDVHVMVFVGFGFLMTFLRKYAFGGIGFTFLISALVIQWGMLCKGLFHIRSRDERIHINVLSLLDADVAAAVVLISLGAVLGKITPLQLLIMAILETPLFAANEYLGLEILKVVDDGGSVFVHVFGAYFGLGVSYVMAYRILTEIDENPLQSSTYQSDVTAMIGTLFLWMFWPSFNAGLLTGDEKLRAIINTYLSLAASCLVTFALSAAFNKNTKFEMIHIQNATLAGGVCVGTTSNMMIYPFGALIIGFIAGTISTFGYRFGQEIILKKLGLHDTCGVNNLHGLPGILAGLISVILALLANEHDYRESFYEVFPAMGPLYNRSPLHQSAFQLLGIMITIISSVCGGLLTGLIIRKILPLNPKDYFEDDCYWEIIPSKPHVVEFRP